MNPYEKWGLIGCGGLIVLLVLIVACAAIVGGPVVQKAVEEAEKTAGIEKENEPAKVAPPAEEEKKTGGNVAVRISGTQGVEYSGSYGATQGQRTVDGTLGASPVEYNVQMRTGTFDFDLVTASFQKRSPGPGALRVEIVSDGEVVASQETTAEFGVASTTYSPQMR